MDGELAMPASSHSLRMTAIVPRARRSIARLILVVLTLCAAGWSTAQAPAPQPRANQEPITPIPLPPVQDPRQVALGDRLFHDARLSHDNTRSCNSCHDTSTNGASVSPPDSRAGAIELNIPTVFNAALNFRLNWEGDLRTLEGQVEQALGKPRAWRSRCANCGPYSSPMAVMAAKRREIGRVCASEHAATSPLPRDSRPASTRRPF
jgi:hypothetical protein